MPLDAQHNAADGGRNESVGLFTDFINSHILIAFVTPLADFFSRGRMT
jgi:hypothetical protein